MPYSKANKGRLWASKKLAERRPSGWGDKHSKPNYNDRLAAREHEAAVKAFLEGFGPKPKPKPTITRLEVKLSLSPGRAARDPLGIPVKVSRRDTQPAPSGWASKDE